MAGLADPITHGMQVTRRYMPQHDASLRHSLSTPLLTPAGGRVEGGVHKHVPVAADEAVARAAQEGTIPRIAFFYSQLASVHS